MRTLEEIIDMLKGSLYLAVFDSTKLFFHVPIDEAIFTMSWPWVKILERGHCLSGKGLMEWKSDPSFLLYSEVPTQK